MQRATLCTVTLGSHATVYLKFDDTPASKLASEHRFNVNRDSLMCVQIESLFIRNRMGETILRIYELDSLRVACSTNI